MKIAETCLSTRTGSAFVCNDVPVGSHKSVRHRGRQRGTERDTERERERQREGDTERQRDKQREKQK